MCSTSCLSIHVHTFAVSKWPNKSSFFYFSHTKGSQEILDYAPYWQIVSQVSQLKNNNNICSQKPTHFGPQTTYHNHFTALFPGPSGWAGAKRELLDFMVQGKINRGRHTDHPAVRHSIWTNKCPPPPSPLFLQAGCPSCHPTNSVKALKAHDI